MLQDTWHELTKLWDTVQALSFKLDFGPEGEMEKYGISLRNKPAAQPAGADPSPLHQ